MEPIEEKVKRIQRNSALIIEMADEMMVSLNLNSSFDKSLYQSLQRFIEHAQATADDAVAKYEEYLSYGRLPGKKIMTDEDDLPPDDLN